MSSLKELIAGSKDLFEKYFNESPSLAGYAPGRINVIGEHTDYNQGLSMPCAINRWITVSFNLRKDNQVYIYSNDFNGEMSFGIQNEYIPELEWEKYIYGCIKIAQQILPFSVGFNALITGNVPVGSGVSSSAALEVAFMNGLNELMSLSMDPLSLIKNCQRVEHEYLHVKSGLLDQYASQFSKEGKLMVLDFQVMSHEYIDAAMDDYCWVLCDTKIKRSLAGSKYSERVEETQAALHQLQKLFPEIKGFRDIQEKHLESVTSPVQRKRMRHFITENIRVKDAVVALTNKQLDVFGMLLTSSHKSLKEDYEVSCEELDYLVEQAVGLPYCLGSRMMGGGFGGCTINLVEKKSVDRFSAFIKQHYVEQFEIETEIHQYISVDGAGVYNF
jgi:galactokinase